MSESSNSENGTLEAAGGALHDERRRQKLSIGDVSRHLKLSVRQVEALENDEFEIFGGSVFVHGFLRNYAKLLGLDSAPLIQSADRKLKPQVTVENEPAIAERPEDNPQKSVVPLLLVAAILIVGVVGWMLTRENQPPAGDAPPSETSGMDSGAVDSFGDVAALTEPGADVSRSGVPGAGMAAANVSVADSGDPVSVRRSRQRSEAAAGEIQFVFTEESWVEVTDRYGEVIYTQLGERGTSRRVRGQPPLSIVIGNAAGVALTYDDKAIDLAPHTRVDVARLRLE